MLKKGDVVKYTKDYIERECGPSGIEKITALAWRGEIVAVGWEIYKVRELEDPHGPVYTFLCDEIEGVDD